MREEASCSGKIGPYLEGRAGAWASPAGLKVLARAGLDWSLEPPSGGSGQPAGTVPRQGRRSLVTQLVPVWVAPRQQGVNLLSDGKASRILLPVRVCSGPGS